MLRDHYRSAHDTASTLTAFGASAAFFLILGKFDCAAAVFSAIVGLAALLDLILQWDAKARTHAELCRKFTELCAQIEELSPTPDNIAKLRAARVRVEVDEPSVKRLADLLAHNDEARSRDCSEDQLIPLSTAQRLLGCWITFGLSGIDKRMARREKLKLREASDLATAEAKEF